VACADVDPEAVSCQRKWDTIYETSSSARPVIDRVQPPAALLGPHDEGTRDSTDPERIGLFDGPLDLRATRICSGETEPESAAESVARKSCAGMRATPSPLSPPHCGARLGADHPQNRAVSKRETTHILTNLRTRVATCYYTKAQEVAASWASLFSGTRRDMDGQ
jgi:hypothetical protein